MKTRPASMTGFFIFMALTILTCPLYGASLAGGEGQSYLTASYYSTDLLKKEGTYAYSNGRMANNKFFRDDGATCACNSYRLGTRLLVTNLHNGKSVVVVVTDRTAKRFTGKRIDLAISQMRIIDGIKQGLVPVKVEPI